MSEQKRPPIPPELLAFAEKRGFPRQPGESDEDYIDRLQRMRGHMSLVTRAARLGAEIAFGMSAQQVRAAINQRLWQLLDDNGAGQGREVTYRDKVYKIRKIYETTGSTQNPAEVKVQLWRVEWEKKSQRGRTIYVTAIDLLRSQGAPETRY